MTGKVKSYNNSTRYGFITRNGEDYRFHNNDWKLRLPPTVGLMVRFDPELTEKGLRAINIKER